MKPNQRGPFETLVLALALVLVLVLVPIPVLTIIRVLVLVLVLILIPVPEPVPVPILEARMLVLSGVVTLPHLQRGLSPKPSRAGTA